MFGFFSQTPSKKEKSLCQCEKYLKQALNDPLALYLAQSIRNYPREYGQQPVYDEDDNDDDKEALSTDFDNIKCKLADSTVPKDELGYYNLKTGKITLWADRMHFPSIQVVDTLRHNLVLAYDVCRWGKQYYFSTKHPSDGRNQSDRYRACTAIRAEMLSGNCRWTREWMRGKVGLALGKSWRGKGEECIRRRALLNVNPNIDDPDQRLYWTLLIETLLEPCMADSSPFLDVP